MLNRRLSDYLFYGTLAAIALVIFLIRSVVIGNMNAEIDNLQTENINLQREIDALSELVQDNRSVQTSHLYELYNTVPNVYSAQSLTYKTVAMLEELGINEEDDLQRTIFIDDTVSFATNQQFQSTLQNYYVVEVQVSFTTTNPAIINDLIDLVYASDQLFIINDVEYTVPTTDNFVPMYFSFFAVYDVETNEES